MLSSSGCMPALGCVAVSTVVLKQPVLSVPALTLLSAAGDCEENTVCVGGCAVHFVCVVLPACHVHEPYSSACGTFLVIPVDIHCTLNLPEWA